MRSRASRKKLDCIFASPKRIVLLACLFSFLMPHASTAQIENKTFESAFGLISRESFEEHNSWENGSPTHAEEAEIPIEAEDLAEEETDLTPVEKSDGEENPIPVLPRTENDFTAKSEPESKSHAVETLSGKMADEKNGKYVRYGKRFLLSMGVTIVSQ